MDQKRQNLKNQLMSQFNFSEVDAEKILDTFEVTDFDSLSNEVTIAYEQQNIQTNDDLVNLPSVSNEENILLQDNTIKENSLDSNNNKGKQSKSRSDFIKKVLGSLDIKIEDDSRRHEDYSKPNNELNNIKKDFEQSEKDSQSVDEILSGIIPDYNQHISIEANHVDLTFEVNNEKVDTIKESFIRTLKGVKTSKLKIHALNDVSFKIYKGEKIGIIGYNGAGKSTLLKVITGIYTPDKGYVKTQGNISPLLSLGAGFDHNYSGRKNIFLNGAVLGYDRDYLESKVDEIIEFSELGEFIDIPIKNYSSGMLAKLGFSIATALEPDILIIDEILGVGDVSFRKKSQDKLRSLMDGGTTVLLVSHSIPQIRELCDKAIWIDKGKLREMGEVNKVCDHYIKDSEKASNDQLANIQLRS